MRTDVWTSTTGHTAVVTPAGELDIASAVELRRALTAAIESPGVRLVVVDLQATTFVDSTILGVLVGAVRRGNRRAVQVLLTAPRSQVARTISLTGLDHLLPGQERRQLRPVI